MSTFQRLGVILGAVVGGVFIVLVLFPSFGFAEESPGPSSVDSSYRSDATHFLGAYYMPKPVGLTHQWRSLVMFNRTEQGKSVFGRKPFLGYYSGADVDAMDWQIKFAVEHGISYWVFDDYWVHSQSTPVYADSMKSYLSARYSNKLYFAAMITDLVTPQGSRSLTRSKLLGDIANRYRNVYFKRSNYLRLNGKPVVYIFNLGVFGRGASDNAWIKSTLAAFETKTGTDIYWIYATPGGNETSYQRYKDMGFDALSPYYTIPQTVLDGQHPSYPDFTNQQRSLQTAMLKRSRAVGLKFIPSIFPNFDERNRSLDDIHITDPRFVNSPTDFTSYLKMQNTMADQVANFSTTAIKKGNKYIVGLGAYNEWIEGAMLDPGTGNVMPDGIFAQLFAVAAKFIPGREPASMTYDLNAIPDFSIDTDSTLVWNFANPFMNRTIYVAPNSSDIQAKEGYGEIIVNNGSANLVIPANVDRLKSHDGIKISYQIECPAGISNCVTAIALRWYTTSCIDDLQVDCPGRAEDINATEVRYINPITNEGCEQATRNGIDWWDCYLVTKDEPSWQNRLEQLSLVFFAKSKSHPIKLRLESIELWPRTNRPKE